MANKALVAAVNRIGGDLLPNNDQYENRFHIKSETSSRKYVVAQNKKTSVWSCSCMGWIRHRRCKHLTTMMPALQCVAETSNVRGVR